jgi:hypothetical protein
MPIWLSLICLLIASGFADQAAEATAPYRVVVVIEENHGYNQIIGNQGAPFINQLVKEGALFTDAHGVWHPSQPNYLALFSGRHRALLTITRFAERRSIPQISLPHLLPTATRLQVFPKANRGSDPPCCPRTDYTRENTILGLIRIS